MSQFQINITILVSAIATYLTRFPSILAGRHLKVTPRLKRGLYYIPIGVFSGMIAPAIFDGITTGTGNHIAFTAAVSMSLVVALRTKSPLWTMLAGMMTIALLRWWI